MNVFARFYDRSIKTNKMDEKTGLPIFKEVCFCEVKIKNNTTDIVDQPATQEKIQTFHKEYQHYLLAKEKEKQGTPLSLFAFFSRQDIEALKLRGVFTLEDFSALTPEKVEDLNLLPELKKVDEFLKVYKNQALFEELKKENTRLKKQIQKLKKEKQNENNN